MTIKNKIIIYGLLLFSVAHYSLLGQACQPFWNIDGTISSTIEYRASQTITAPFLTPTNIVSASTGHVFYRAGRSVTLNPGFQTAVSGTGFFEAAIQPCTDTTPLCNIALIDFEDCRLSTNANQNNPLMTAPNIYPRLRVHSGSPNIVRMLDASLNCTNINTNWYPNPNGTGNIGPKFPYASTAREDVFNNSETNNQFLAMFFRNNFFSPNTCVAPESQGETMFIRGPFLSDVTYTLNLDMRVIPYIGTTPLGDLNSFDYTPELRFILVNNIMNNGTCTRTIINDDRIVWTLAQNATQLNKVLEKKWTHQVVTFTVPHDRTFTDLWLRGSYIIQVAGATNFQSFVLNVDNIRLDCGDNNSGPIGVGNLPIKQKVNQQLPTLSPNPTATRFTLNGIDDFSHTDIQVYDITGRSVKQYRKPATSEFDVSDLPNGMYIVKIVTDNQLLSTHKLTISK